MKEINEYNTSHTCAKCGEHGERYKGRFRCSGTEIHSDVNGAWNIAKRGISKLETKSLEISGAS